MIGFQFAQPFLISSAITSLSEPDDAFTKNDGYGLIGATFLIYVGLAVSLKAKSSIVRLTVIDLQCTLSAATISKCCNVQRRHGTNDL